MSQVRPIGKGRGGAFAYRRLRDDIVSLALEPGADLEEAGLVARLGLSRTPVREALVRLAGEGLVELLPNRGARVAPMGWGEIREHLEALDVMQRLVTRWAASRRTDAQIAAVEARLLAFEAAATAAVPAAMIDANWDFHAAIAAACGNGFLEAAYRRLLTANLRIARLAMTYECFESPCHYDAHVGRILDQHRGMLAAIRDRDGDAAERLAGSHADLARRRVAETLTRPPRAGETPDLAPPRRGIA